MYVEEYHSVFLGFSGWNIKKKKNTRGNGEKRLSARVISACYSIYVCHSVLMTRRTSRRFFFACTDGADLIL